jgi:DNA replication protein DnaC
MDDPVNETWVRDLAGGDFLDQQRNVVPIGGTGTGKSHLAVGVARACIRSGKRGRFFNAVDLVNKLDAEARADRQGRTTDLLCRHDFVILDELGYLPFARTGGQLLLHLISRLCERTSILVMTNLDFGEWPVRHRSRTHGDAMAHLRRRQDDDRAPRSAHAPLRHRRDRQRELALQDPRLTDPPLARSGCAV